MSSDVDTVTTNIFHVDILIIFYKIFFSFDFFINGCHEYMLCKNAEVSIIVLKFFAIHS